jgi:hypothetical protein
LFRFQATNKQQIKHVVSDVRNDDVGSEMPDVLQGAVSVHHVDSIICDPMGPFGFPVKSFPIDHDNDSRPKTTTRVVI